MKPYVLQTLLIQSLLPLQQHLQLYLQSLLQFFCKLFLVIYILKNIYLLSSSHLMFHNYIVLIILYKPFFLYTKRSQYMTYENHTQAYLPFQNESLPVFCMEFL